MTQPWWKSVGRGLRGPAVAGSGLVVLGARLANSLAPALNPLELAGLPAGASAPATGSREERAAAHAIAESFHAATASAVAEAWRAVEPEPGVRKRLLGLTHLFR